MDNKEKYSLIKKDGTLSELGKKVEPKAAPRTPQGGSKFKWFLVAAMVPPMYIFGKRVYEEYKITKQSYQEQYKNKPRPISSIEKSKPNSNGVFTDQTHEGWNFVGFQGNTPVDMDTKNRMIVNYQYERVEFTKKFENSVRVSSIDFNWIEKDKEGNILFESNGYPKIRTWYKPQHFIVNSFMKFSEYFYD